MSDCKCTVLTPEVNDEKFMPYVAKLYAKLAAVAKEIGAVDKEGENTFQKWKYITYEQMQAKLRAYLPKFGLYITPSIVDSKLEDIDGDKKITTRVTVKMKFRIVDTETGFCVVENWECSESDTNGKAHMQAGTACVKYFQFKLFHVSSQEEVDPDSKITEVLPSVTVGAGVSAVIKKLDACKDVDSFTVAKKDAMVAYKQAKNDNERGVIMAASLRAELRCVGFVLDTCKKYLQTLKSKEQIDAWKKSNEAAIEASSDCADIEDACMERILQLKNEK